MMVSVVNGAIQINQIRNNSLFNQGKLVANSWAYYNKSNMSVGQIAGNLNVITSGLNILCDPDAIDNNLPNAGGQSPTVGGNTEAF